MPIRPRHISVISAAVLVLAFTSCNDRNPTSPTPAPPTGPPAPTPATIVRLEIVAPSEIEPGESVQLIANAVRSDGSVENVSSQVRWNPATSPIIQISSTGLATGRARGEAFVSAQFSNRFANARIFVLPRGTFRIQGVVREAGFGIAGVTVAVISGVGEGLTTTTGFGGFYALYGVSGPVQIHTKRDGYVNAIHQLTVTAHTQRDLDIVAERARSDYRGDYELTISLVSPCRFNSGGVLPDAAKRRVYAANVSQNGAALTVTLSGADFVVVNGHGRGFTGFVDVNGGVRFVVGDAFYYYYYYGGSFDIAERISDFTLLMSGIAALEGSPTRLSGPFEGSIVTSRSTSRPFTPFVAQCHGSAHGFEMVRR